MEESVPRKRLVEKLLDRIQELADNSIAERRWYLSLLSDKEIDQLDQLLNIDIIEMTPKKSAPIKKMLNRWKKALG
jgi:hypothetical protein